MSAASVSGNGLSRVHYILPDTDQVPSNPSTNPIALQDRQYEGCVTVVPATTWLPPSYTSCVVQETPIPCYAPYPPSTCPAATPTPQSNPPNSNSDSSQSQSGSQSNTSSDASVNVGGGSGSQNIAIIVGVTIGAVVLLILIVVLAVRGAHRRRRTIPRVERGIVMGPNYLVAGVRSDLRALDMHGHRDQRAASRAVGGGNGGGAPGRNGTGDTRDTGRKPSAGVVRDASKSSKKHAERDISRGTPAPISMPEPPAEIRKADVNPPEPIAQQRHSRHSSRIGRSRSRYRADGHDEHPQYDHLYSPGPRWERMQRRKRRQGGSADEDGDPFGAERESGMPNDIPLPSSPLRDVAMGMGMGVGGEVEHDVQSPGTGRWRHGKAYVPYPHRRAEEDESAA